MCQCVSPHIEYCRTYKCKDDCLDKGILEKFLKCHIEVLGELKNKEFLETKAAYQNILTLISIGIFDNPNEYS